MRRAAPVIAQDVLELLLLIDDLDAMLIGLLGGLLPYGSKIGVHGEDGGRS